MAKSTSTGNPTRRFRPRRITLANGELLVLHRDGTIEHTDAAGAVKQAWSPGDPDWPRHAIRFGLHETRPTVKPTGRDASSERPPV